MLHYDPTESSCPAITKLLMRLKYSLQKADQIETVTNSIISLLTEPNNRQPQLDRLFFFLESELKLNRNEHSNLGMYLINALLDRL